MLQTKHRSLVYSFIVMLLWGLLFPTVKLGYRVFGISEIPDILAFAGFRFVVCGAIIVAYAAIKDLKSFHPVKKHLGWVLLSGVFAIILHYAFTYVGLRLTDGSKTAIIKQLGAIFYICFAGLFFKEDKMTKNKLLGLVLSVMGILVINVSATGIAFHLGDVLILGASFCTVFSNVVSKKVFRYVEPIVSTGVSQLFGGVILMIVGAMAGSNVVDVLPRNAADLGVFVVIVFASVISYALWFVTVKKENLSRLFIIKFSEPLFAALFSWIIIGEDILKLNYLLAFIFISAGIMVANLSKRTKIT